MANIRIDLEATVINGQTLTFKSPVDCSQITGLKVYYPEGNAVSSRVFQFADAHGNNVGSVSLFAENVLVKVILDTDLNRAYVQNADTNAYLEAALAGKAPAGFGLGDVGALFDIGQTGNIDKNGWYAFSQLGTTINGVTFDNANMRVDAFDPNSFRQTLYPITANNLTLSRERVFGGVYTPWECHNPPMIANVEYRTTERWHGVPVYTQLYSFGPIPVNSSTDEPVMEPFGAGVTRIIRSVCNLSNGESFSNYYNFGGTTISYRASPHAVEFTCSGNTSDLTAFIQVWYTK